MQHSNFVHLHTHSQYSLLDGAIRPEALVKTARKMKMPAVAVTDHGNLFGAVEFYELAMKNGVKPIIGCEVYVAPGDRTDKSPRNRGSVLDTNSYHLILLVMNDVGYVNLCKLISTAYIDGFYYKPRIDKTVLRECSEGLIALSACLHGEVAYNFSRGLKDEAQKIAAEFKEIFPDRRFFLELQHNGIEEQERVNAGLIEIGRRLDIPLVATNDCHYLLKEDARVHDILLCIQTGTTVNAQKRMRFATDHFYFKSPEEMIEAFKDLPEAIENTVEIAERCNLEMRLKDTHMPEYPAPDGKSLDEIITEKAKEGLEARFAVMAGRGEDVESVKWNYYDRLDKELKVIKGMGFPGYFLIVADFIDYARSIDIPVGPGRGSAAGSLVAYSLGITNIDPITYNLLFERFLNPDRISLPDIDIDFCYERREEVIKYVTKLYGPENVTQIITFGLMRARACLRDVGRVLDMPYGDVDRIAKLVPAELNITIEKALEKEPKLQRLVNEDAKVAELVEVARALENLPRHASTHAAGVVISNRPLVNYLPLYKGQKENIITTQFPMKDVEKIGLVKFDFLGLKTLTVIDRAIKFVKSNRGEELDLDTLALDDAKAYRLVASGNTDGVFQLESSGMKELLRKLKPEVFEDMIAAVALYRPGPLQSGMVDDFINRKHKVVKVVYDHELLKVILENTYGVMVYQEQVMEIARSLAHFTPGDADLLRKAMGKKNHDEMLVQRNKFIEGSVKNEIPKKTAEKIFDLMAKFAGYGFNKSHSAAYALIAYHTAYLKAHYPVEFMAALLSSDMGTTDNVVKYINECRNISIEVNPPDINESGCMFTVSGDSIRFALGAIKNVGSAAIDNIIEIREDGPFESLVDFLVRVDSRKVNKKVIESLVKCGAFDFTGIVGPRRAALLETLGAEMETAAKVQRDREEGQGSIFDMLGDGAGNGGAGGVKEFAYSSALSSAEWTEAELLAAEKETLGFYFSSHPLQSHLDTLKEYATCAIEGLMEIGHEETVAVGGVISSFKEITTRKGDRMAFVTLDGLSGNVEVVVFSDLYAKVSELIRGEGPVMVAGRTDKDEREVKLVATGMVPLEEASNLGAKVKARIAQISLRADSLDKGRLMELKGILEENPGRSPVFLRLLYPDDRVITLSTSDKLRITTHAEALEKIAGLGAVTGVKVR